MWYRQCTTHTLAAKRNRPLSVSLCAIIRRVANLLRLFLNTQVSYPISSNALLTNFTRLSGTSCNAKMSGFFSGNHRYKSWQSLVKVDVMFF